MVPVWEPGFLGAVDSCAVAEGGGIQSVEWRTVRAFVGPAPRLLVGPPTLGSCALPGLGPVGGGDIKFQPGRSPGSGRGVGRVRRTLQKVPVDKPVNPEAECSCVRVCVWCARTRVCACLDSLSREWPGTSVPLQFGNLFHGGHSFAVARSAWKTGLGFGECSVLFQLWGGAKWAALSRLGLGKLLCGGEGAAATLSPPG